jgi:spermidine synthase
VREVTLVDLDPMMTQLFAEHPTLVALNDSALRSPRVRIVNADAFIWLQEDAGTYDFVVVDFPDPNNYGVGKLYTTAFYKLLARHLAPEALVAVQSTSPLFARTAFWSIASTLEQAGLTTWPYHVYVPSFGEWGFMLAGREPRYIPPATLPAGLRFLTASIIPELFHFPADMSRVPAEPNRLNTQVLVRYYADEWEKYNR